MQRTTGKRPISRSAFDSLEADLAELQDRLRSELQDASDIMRGWSDLAEKAAYAASIEPTMRRIAELRGYLQTVFPSDDLERPSTRNRSDNKSIDEIIAEAWENAGVYRLEVWDDGRFVQELPIPIGDGPLDSKVVAKKLRAEGIVGELRLVAGTRGSPQERCVSTEILAPRPLNEAEFQEVDDSVGISKAVAPSRETIGDGAGTSSSNPQSGIENEPSACTVEIGDIEDYFDGRQRRFCLRTRQAIRHGSVLISQPRSGTIVSAVSKAFPSDITSAASSRTVCTRILEEFLTTLAREGWERLPAKGRWWYSTRLSRTYTQTSTQ